MSRIGKQPIKIPKGVEVKISLPAGGQAALISVKGPRGEASRDIPEKVLISRENDLIAVNPKDNSKEASSLWGTYRALVNNMVKGVTEGFEKSLVYEGVGFKSEIKNDSSVESGKILELSMGFTNPVRITAPKGIDLKVERNQITVTGIDKELVGQVAANIRKVKPVEPYKGKGIRYKDEIVLRKAGKKAVAGG